MNNKKFKKITLKAEKGIMFEMEETSKGLLIRAINMLKAAEYVGDYTNPPIPERYTYVKGEWNTGYVIKDKKSNEFVWVPVGVLAANGTLDGTNFNEKFGRRNYRNDEFSSEEFHEEMDEMLKKQFESVQKYGGFYISRYEISKSAKDKPASVQGAMPWTNIDFDDASKVSKELGQGNVKSHLVYGAEFDSVLEWFIATGKTHDEIGSRNEWYVNNIADLFSNTWEWTQENESSYRVLRCGSYNYNGYNLPMAVRISYFTIYYSNYIGFRVALYIE